MTPLLTATEDLAAACARLAEGSYVTVDTEFMRESTYYPKLCLVQLAGPEEAVVVDPLAPGLDLKPFFDLMADTRTVKVFHAARQDLEIIWLLGRVIPEPLFDTQVAAMVCGYGDSASYEQLAHDFAKARIDKSHRFTDWARRPLSDAQLTYAAGDVTHLRDVYLGLRARLDVSGREGWLDEEMAVLRDPGTYETQPEDAWRRLSGRVRRPGELAVLIELAAWREREAKARDVPRGRVMKDDALVEVASAAPRTAESLGALRAVPNGFERSRAGPDILAAVERGRERDPATLPVLERSRGGAKAEGAADLLKLLLRIVAREAGVAPKVIATVDDLEEFGSGAGGRLSRGWRHEVFGARAEGLLAGATGVGLKGGRLAVVPVAPAEVASGEPAMVAAEVP